MFAHQAEVLHCCPTDVPLKATSYTGRMSALTSRCRNGSPGRLQRGGRLSNPDEYRHGKDSLTLRPS